MAGTVGTEGRWQWLPPLGVAVFFSLCGILLYWPVSPFSSTTIVGCGCGDRAQEVWFLAWPVFALLHGHNPFYSGYIGYPEGANLTINTSMPLLGLLAAPVTLLAGPVAAFNFVLRLSFPASAGALYFVLRRWQVPRPASFVGGLVYGFSPLMLGEGLGHAFVTFAPLPPLMCFVSVELFITKRWSWQRAGAALGLLATAQYYVSPEILLDTVLLIAAGVLLAALSRPREVAARLMFAARALGLAAATVALLCGYAFYLFVAGPQHVKGPAHPSGALDAFHADLLSSFVPTALERLTTAGLSSLSFKMIGRDISETGAYLGIPLFVFLVVVSVKWFGDLRIRLAAALAVVAFVLSLGSHLRVGGHQTGVPLPFLVLEHLPLTGGLLAGRFTLFEQLFVAIVAAFGLARARATALGRPGATLIALCCLVFLVPAGPYPEARTGVPAFFTSRAALRIPEGSVVLAYPYPWTPDSQAMLWQAVTGMRFKLLGGDFIHPGPTGTADSTPTILDPSYVEALLEFAMVGHDEVPRTPSRPIPAASGLIRSFLSRYHVGTIVVDPVGAHPERVVAAFTAALARPPEHRGGVDLWTDVEAAVSG